METITLAQPVEEVPECYICMEPETPEMPFLTKQMCPCSSKADSSLKVHQLCLELSRDRTGKCHVCKKPLSGDWAFDGRFFQKSIYGSERQFEQRSGGVPNGIYFTLKPTNAYNGPIRWLAIKGFYKDGKLHGPQLTLQQDGSAATERNYLEGELHGKTVERDVQGKVTLEENYEGGMLHGSRMELYHGIQLTGQFEHGVRVGEHLEVQEAPAYNFGEGTRRTDYINRVNYKAGIRDGPFLQFHLQVGESLPTEIAVYRDGKLNGLQLQWVLNHEELTRKPRLEAQWVDGKRNGRYASFFRGELEYEAWYYMDQKHGLERTYLDGKLHTEETWHLGTKHGRVREWDSLGHITMDAAYDNGFRHGRFISSKEDSTEVEEFWSDGTKELRHGVHRITVGSRVEREVNYKMGVRHGTSLKHNRYDDGYVLHYRNGKLHGQCHVMFNDKVQAQGSFCDGVPVGRHLLMDDGVLRESINYDSEGRLHGKCIFNQSDGTPFQVHNYKHGQLHGRQVIYFPGTCKEKRVFNMRLGRVHGRFRMYDERGAEVEHMQLKEDEGITLQECLGKDALCAPSERKMDGTYSNRWTRADGTIFPCPNQAAGNDCKCDECYVPPARKPVDDDYCGCALCCSYNDETPDTWSDDDDEEERYEAWLDRYRSRYEY